VTSVADRAELADVISLFPCYPALSCWELVQENSPRVIMQDVQDQQLLGRKG
jgi:hypothetical protein